MTDRALKIVKRAEPWRQRLIRGMLYGRNVDRAAKARARVGFAMLAFAAIYAVIGGRLVMFALGADNHAARRTAAQDAIATSLIATAKCSPRTSSRRVCSASRAGSSTRMKRSSF
jgi:cell division protein FtsI (penicillin-binding protein 3)